jgi:PKD repeat protein
VTVDEAKFTTALFRGPQTLSLRLTGTGGATGHVALSPGDSVCVLNGEPQVTCTSVHRVGTVVTLSSLAGTGPTVFLGWTGCSSPTNVCTMTIENATTVTAAYRVNNPPVASAGGPYSGFKGEPISFDGTASHDPDGDPITYLWSFGDGSTGSGPTPTHVYAALGTYQVKLVVNDGLRNSSDSFAVATVRNRPPVANAGGPYSGVRGTAIVFDGSGSTDGDGDPLTYAWDFGDGSTGTGPSATHAYATLGTFTVTLVVSDGIDSSAPAPTTVTITNRVPVASAGGPYSGAHGVALAFDASASTDADGDPLTFAWTFGDGGTGSGPTPSHTYTTDGSYTVTVQVSDGVDTATASTTATIANVVPIAQPGGPYTGFKNAPFVLDGTASSDGNGDALTHRWDFGDGTTGTGPTPSHTYVLPPGNPAHVYTVTLIVNDGLADSAPITTTVQVQDHPPVAHPGGPYNTFRNQPITLSGSLSSDPDGDPLTYAWDFGDGTTGTGVAPSHTYTAFGTYVVRLTVNDGHASSTPATTQVTVPDRPPVAHAGGPYSGVRGVAITFNGSASVDPDGNPLTYQWNFGDGTTGTGVSPTHVYTTVGSFVARLVVSDGGPQPSAESTAAVTIANRPPVAKHGGPYTGKRMLAVQLNGSASTDPDGDPLTYAWTFGDGGTGTGVSPTHVYTTLGTFTITLKVNDGFVNSPTVSTTVTITNAAPIANAGPDRTVLRNTSVTLDGRASSDPDGTIAAWKWRQLSGPSVNLINSTTSQPRFTAPNVNNPKILDFELKVTDSNGATAIDTVKITVIRP